MKQQESNKEYRELKKKIIKKSELYGTLLWMNINIDNRVINNEYIESMLGKSDFKFYLFYDAIVILFPPPDNNTNGSFLTELPQENGYAFKVEYIKFANGEIINYRELLLLSKEKLKVKLEDSKIIYFRDSKHYLQDYLRSSETTLGGGSGYLSTVFPAAKANAEAKEKKAKAKKEAKEKKDAAAAQAKAEAQAKKDAAAQAKKDAAAAEKVKTFIMIIVKILANLNSKTNNLIKLKEPDLGNTKKILKEIILKEILEKILKEIKLTDPKKIDTDKLKTMMPLISFDDKKKKKKKNYICGFEYKGKYYPIQLFLSKMPFIIHELPYSLLTYDITDLKNSEDDIGSIINKIYSVFEIPLSTAADTLDLLYNSDNSKPEIVEILGDDDNYKSYTDSNLNLTKLTELFNTLMKNESVKVYYISDLKKLLIDGGKRDQSNINYDVLLSGNNTDLTKSMTGLERRAARARARGRAGVRSLSSGVKSISSKLRNVKSGIASTTSDKYKYLTGKKKVQEEKAKQAQQGGKGNGKKKKYKKMRKTKKIYKRNKKKTQKYKK